MLAMELFDVRVSFCNVRFAGFSPNTPLKVLSREIALPNPADDRTGTFQDNSQTGGVHSVLQFSISSIEMPG